MEKFYEGRLIRVESRKVYGTIDVDTWRDGHWDLPAPFREQLCGLMVRFKVFPYDISKSGLNAHRVPLEIIHEVARGVAEILAPFRSARQD